MLCRFYISGRILRVFCNERQCNTFHQRDKLACRPGILFVSYPSVTFSVRFRLHFFTKMGCGASTLPVSDIGRVGSSGKSNAMVSGSNRIESSFYVQTINHKAPMIRLDHCEEPKMIPIKGTTYEMNLKIVYVSQRGFYPSDPNKANQDSYLICESLLGDRSCNMFGIFDGHGTYGDLCAYYAADEMPKHLVKGMNKNGGLTSLDGESANEIYSKAFTETDKCLHNNHGIEDSLSGTTGVTILQKGDRLLVANVGDSRAIIASMVDGKLQYSPLSNDQTPYRKDERERLKKAGAKIMTIDQVEGNEPIHENFGMQLGNEIDEGGDPPRVWDATLEKPGCAFSRSIGDNVAKKVGVCAEPEIQAWDLSPDDKFAIIASDGVFEFITSQNVIEMLAKFSDPIEAAKHVVAEAYRLWLTYDDRTDDITMIVLYFEDVKARTDASGASVTRTPREGGAGRIHRAMSISKGMTSDGIIRESRPVRKVMSRARRAEITENFEQATGATEERFDFDAVVDNKSKADIARISKMLDTNFMFQNLTTLQKEKVIRVMTQRRVAVDEMVIKEGDRGDEMYIVDSGEFIVRKMDELGVEQVVFVYTVEGSAFGELSLMYGKPRAASVIAKTQGTLWCIGRAAFRAVIMLGKQDGDGLLEIYRSIPVFKDLSLPTLQRLCTSAVEKTFEKNSVLFTEETAADADWCFALGTKFSEARADGKLRMSCVPAEVCHSVLGTEGMAALRETVERSKCKGKRIEVPKSIFEVAENFRLTKQPDPARFAVEHPTALLGQFGYVAQFKDTTTQKLVSIKVVAKAKSAQLRMDGRMLQERNLLAAMHNEAPPELDDAQEAWMPTPLGVMQDEKKVYLIYKDLYACDLSVALSGGAIEAADKPHYAACISSGLRAVHEFGLLHRFINASSVYVTTSGTPKICDFRFAKQMKGSYSFTICGDPLFFAPEIVNHQGYDYAADLWALGVLIFELYEECSPFGSADTDETTIFKRISAFKGELPFTDKTPAAARAAVSGWLNPAPQLRTGYLMDDAVKNCALFSGIQWSALGGSTRGAKYVDVQPSIDLTEAFSDAQLEPWTTSTAFDHY